MRRPPKVPRPTAVPLAVSPTLGESPTLQTVARLRETSTVAPYVEADADPALAVVTFLLDAPDAEAVLLFVNRLTDETRLDDSLMRRVPGTSWWWLSYRMPRDWRASYAFVVQRHGEPAPWLTDDQVAIRTALDHGIADPQNPLTSTNRRHVLQSVVALDRAPAQPWVARRPGVPRGDLTEVRGPRDRRVWVYEPAGSPRTPTSAGAVVVLDGDAWTSTQDLPTTLDNLVADGAIPPVRAFFLDAGGRDARWRTMGADGDDGDDGDDAAYVTDELVGWVRERYGAATDPRTTVVTGQSLGGLTALRTALRAPHLVGGVVAQSASLWLDDLAGLVYALPAAPHLRVHLEVGLQEWVLLEPHRTLARRLHEAGVDVRTVEYQGGHDDACWRGGIADGLHGLLGRE